MALLGAIAKQILIGAAGGAIVEVTKPVLVQVGAFVFGTPKTPVVAPVDVGGVRRTRVEVDQGALGDTLETIGKTALAVLAPEVEIARRGAEGALTLTAAEKPKKTCCESCKKGGPCCGVKTSGEDEDNDDNDDELEVGVVDEIYTSGGFNPFNFSDPFGQQADADLANAKATNKTQQKQLAQLEKEAKEKLAAIEKKYQALQKEAEKRAGKQSKEVEDLRRKITAVQADRRRVPTMPAAQQAAIAATPADKMFTLIEKILVDKLATPAAPAAPAAPAPIIVSPWGPPPAATPAAAPAPTAAPTQPQAFADPWGQALPPGLDPFGGFQSADPWAAVDLIAADAVSGADPWGPVIAGASAAPRPKPQQPTCRSCVGA